MSWRCLGRRFLRVAGAAVHTAGDQRFAVVYRRLERRQFSFRFWCSMWTLPPENVGSGKFGTPCERMHAAAFRYCSCCAGVRGA